MASAWQTIQQVRKIVADAAWSTSPSDKVIGDSVYVTAGIEEDYALPGRIPFALLNLGDCTTDDDDPDLLMQDIILILVTGVEGHDLGEHNLLGGPSGQTPRSAYSAGRGLLEIETAILEEVGQLTGADGTPILVTHGSAPGPQWLEGRSVAWRQYILSCLCTRADEYPAPSRLVATGGAGQIACSWDLPASRFDLDSIILRYAVGATPPATHDAGTGITLGSDLATSVTKSGLAADDYSLALFAKYVDTNAADPSYSAQVTGTTRTSVTVS